MTGFFGCLGDRWPGSEEVAVGHEKPVEQAVFLQFLSFFFLR